MADLQYEVLQGKFGNQPGILKPFDKLKKSELQEELSRRGMIDVDQDKKELAATLASILRGAQRVPTILLTNPSQCLHELNLGQYEVLDPEPLHDFNILTELPHILESSVKNLCLDLLNSLLFSRKQGGYSGSDLRIALLETHKLLHSQRIDQNIKNLLSTAVKISMLQMKNALLKLFYSFTRVMCDIVAAERAKVMELDALIIVTKDGIDAKQPWDGYMWNLS